MAETNEPALTTGERHLQLTYAQVASRFHISGDAARQLVRRRKWQKLTPARQGVPALIVVPKEELQPEQSGQEGSKTAKTPDEDAPADTRIAALPAAFPTAPAAKNDVSAAKDGEIDLLQRQVEAEQRDGENLPDTGIEALQAGFNAMLAAKDDVIAAKDSEITRLQEQVDAEQRARKRADQALAAERNRADAVRDKRDAAEWRAGQAENEAHEARMEAQKAREALEAMQRAEEARRSLSRFARLRLAWWGR